MFTAKQIRAPPIASSQHLRAAHLIKAAIAVASGSLEIVLQNIAFAVFCSYSICIPSNQPKTTYEKKNCRQTSRRFLRQLATVSSLRVRTAAATTRGFQFRFCVARRARQVAFCLRAVKTHERAKNIRAAAVRFALDIFRSTRASPLGGGGNGGCGHRAFRRSASSGGSCQKSGGGGI